ncbi:MAG: hypothetical protein R3D30_05580 [Hyphomicrobiales bacterium]
MRRSRRYQDQRHHGAQCGLPRRIGLRASCARPTPIPPSGPHRITVYVPEVPFVMDEFLADVDAVYSTLGRCKSP